MTAGDRGTQIVLSTGETGDPDKDYNIPPDATVMLYVAPVTVPPIPPVGYVASTNADAISATYLSTGIEFIEVNGGYYYVQLRIIGPGNIYLFQSAVDKKYIDPGFPVA